MTTRLQNYINPENAEPAKDDGYIETTYTGKSPTLIDKTTGKGKKGKAYYNVKDDQWYFRPVDSIDWFRVHTNNLDCIGTN